MDFLPVTSDVHLLELVYGMYPDLSKQCLEFNSCMDISLGLIETNHLKAVLSAEISPARLEDVVITLRSLDIEHFNDRSVVKLEPLQQIKLHFEKGRAVMDDMPRMLATKTPYYPLVQHLVMARLEYLLAEMDVFYLEVNAKITEEFAALLQLRGYHYTRGTYNKYLLMTDTANVMP